MARQIVKEIQAAENTQLPSGERIVDVLSQLWNLISEARVIHRPEYTGPLRKREGGEEVDDIVAHKIGVAAGDVDPATRRKEAEQHKIEQVIREIQLRIVGDKSGSMSQTVEGESKWQLQRRAMYLILSSLDRAQKNLQRVAAKMGDPLAIQTEVISFRDAQTIDVDKPLSSEFTLADKVRLWHSLGEQGWGNGDVAALQHLYQEISEEQEVRTQQGKKDDILRVIIACSDGEPDSVQGVHKMAQALGELHTVIVGIGMTETAAKVPVIFDTEYSKGDFAKDMNDLPAIFAKHVVQQALHLFPEKTKQAYQRSLDAMLAKFTNVGLR